MPANDELRKQIDMWVNQAYVNGMLDRASGNTQGYRTCTDLILKVVATHTNKAVLEAISLIGQRQGNQYLMCDTCYSRSGSRLGGAAITSWKCAKCSGGQLSGSTAHGSLCIGCAITYGKCEWCNYNENRLAQLKKESEDR